MLQWDTEICNTHQGPSGYRKSMATTDGPWPPECEAELTTYSLMTTSTYSPKIQNNTLCSFWLWCQLQAIDGIPNSKGLWFTCLTSWPKCILYSRWLCIMSRPPIIIQGDVVHWLFMYNAKHDVLWQTDSPKHNWKICTYIHTSQKWTPILSATCLVC